MDAFRQSLFDLRDRVFDYGVSGAVDFDHAAYRTLRTMINGSIRFGHELTAWNAMVIMALLSKDDLKMVVRRTYREQWMQATKDLDPDVRSQLEEYRQRMYHLCGFYFFLTSPHAVLLIIPLVIMTGIRHPQLLTAEMKQVNEGERSKQLPNVSPQEFKQVFGEIALIYGEQSPKAAGISATASV